MKKFFASLAIAATLIFAPAQKSEAAVGLIAAPAVVTIGGIVAITGGVVIVDSLAEGICARVLDNAHGMGCLGTFMLGALVGGIGLLVLDGEQTTQFAEADSSMTHLQGVTSEEIGTYNSELDQLNAINAQISSEVTADKNTDAKARWSELGEMLSPATLKIAGLNGELLLKSLK